MNIDARLDRLETAARELDPLEQGLSRKEVLDRIYDSWVNGQPSGLPPPIPKRRLTLILFMIASWHPSRNGPLEEGDRAPETACSSGAPIEH
jgi:hypothetical protein